MERAPEKTDNGAGEDKGDRPLGAAFLSVRPVNSPARSLRAYLRGRMEQPDIATETENRLPARLRALIAILLAVGSWGIVFGGAWLVLRYIRG